MIQDPEFPDVRPLKKRQGGEGGVEWWLWRILEMCLESELTYSAIVEIDGEVILFED
jgi:hypothetical protein